MRLNIGPVGIGSSQFLIVNSNSISRYVTGFIFLFPFSFEFAPITVIVQFLAHGTVVVGEVMSETVVTTFASVPFDAVGESDCDPDGERDDCEHDCVEFHRIASFTKSAQSIPNSNGSSIGMVSPTETRRPDR